MNKYRAIYYYGRDRDDWHATTFEADTLEDAERQARESTMRGYNYKSIRLIENQ
jgi:hypothetical protein